MIKKTGKKKENSKLEKKLEKKAKPSAKKNKQEPSLLKNVIGTIVFIGMGLLTLVSVFNLSGGILLIFIRKLLFNLIGMGAYTAPLVLILVGVLYLLRNKVEDVYQKIIALNIILVVIISWQDIYLTPYLHDGAGLFERFSYAKALDESGIGGGLVGTFIGYILLKFFGILGSYIVLSVAAIIAILLGAHKLVFSKLKAFFNKEKQINKNKKKKKEDKNLKNTKRTKSKPILEKKEIKIMDYANKVSETQCKKENSTETKTDESEESILEQINKDDILYTNYEYPSVDFLNKVENQEDGNNNEKLEEAKKLEEVLSSFGVETTVNQISIGPTITRYELEIAPGIKISKITNLSANIALGLASTDIRIEAPIPGKAAVGIEVPNKSRRPVVFREVLDTDAFNQIETKIPFAIGKDISGKPLVVNLEKMPHLLIAGATGSGKSVCINTLIASILYKSSPDEVKFIMIDPKVVELNVYNGIPHLLIPVVTNPKKAANALNWAVQEMTERYQKFADLGVRDFSSYNEKMEKSEKLPQIIVLIDELADLMMVSPGDVEDSICRLAQMARAAGIHLIIATQRPSVDVITGTIKANIPSRIAFAVSSQTDSRTILGFGGAEKLLGRGDMLYFPVGESKPIRLQGSFIAENELNVLLEFLKNQKVDDTNPYAEKIDEAINKETISTDGEDYDELLDKAIDIISEHEQTSISFLQRKLKVGYARAARIMDQLEEKGAVSGHEGSKPRKVLIDSEQEI
jgi:S-DNA-T family DNA segregation ATPase FtsK/SpoIIIE